MVKMFIIKNVKCAFCHFLFPSVISWSVSSVWHTVLSCSLWARLDALNAPWRAFSKQPCEGLNLNIKLTVCERKEAWVKYRGRFEERSLEVNGSRALFVLPTWTRRTFLDFISKDFLHFGSRRRLSGLLVFSLLTDSILPRLDIPPRSDLCFVVKCFAF